MELENQMKTFLTIRKKIIRHMSYMICALLSLNSFSADYFIDTELGDDNFDGTASQPWKSLANVNSGSFQPGDRIILACGQVWREQISLNEVDNGPLSLTITKPDDCVAHPIISGADVISNWSLYDGNIYVADVPDTISELYANGRFIRSARYPNEGFLSTNLSAENIGPCPAPSSGLVPHGWSGNCAMRDANLESYLASVIGAPEQGLVGGRIIMQTADYHIDTRDITGFNGMDVISWDERSRYILGMSSGQAHEENYYLENKLWMLDQPGEWAHDAAAGKLYVWLADNVDPNTVVIEATVRSTGIHIDNADSIGIKNISVKHFSDHGIVLNNVDTANVVDNHIIYTGHAITANLSSTQLTISRNAMLNLLNDGIKILRSDSADINIYKNNIINVGTAGADVGSPRSSLGALYSVAGGIIEKNRIVNSNYLGIRADGNTTIKSNSLLNICSVLSDCGGIYLYGGIDARLTPFVDERIVENNIVNHVDGNGIYLDDFANNVTLRNNTVTHSSHGILIHLAYNNRIENNTFYANEGYQVFFSENLNSDYDGTVHTNEVTNNIFFPINTNPASHWNALYSNTDFAIFEANYYSQLYSDNAVSINNDLFPFTQWQSAGWLGRLMETNGVLGAYILEDVLAGPVQLVSNGDFSDGLNDWTAEPASVAHLLNGQNIPFLSTQDYSGTFTSSEFSLTENQEYRLSFTVRNFVQLPITIKRNDGSINDLGFQELIDINPEFQQISYTFSATESVTDAVFHIDIPENGRLFIHDIQLITTNQIENGNFDTGSLAPWFTWNFVDNNYVNLIGDCNHSGACLEYVNATHLNESPGNTLASSNELNIKEGANYKVSFDALTNAPTHVIVRANGDTTTSGIYAILGLHETFDSQGQWQTYEYVFTATESSSLARFQFEQRPGQTMRFDNVELVEVDAEFNDDPYDDSLILINTADTDQHMHCPLTNESEKCGEFVDLNGSIVEWPRLVPALNSEVLIWANNPFLR